MGSMSSHLVCADQNRVEQYMILGSVRGLFQDYQIATDAGCITWALQRHGGHGYGVTWLGQGWAFDSYARRRREQKLSEQREQMENASHKRHCRELKQALQHLRLGGRCERMLFLSYC